MRVLWVCNIMLPYVAKHLNLEVSNKEGWISGIASVVLKNHNQNQIQLGVCFPVGKDLAGYKEDIPLNIEGEEVTISAYGFQEEVGKAEKYQMVLEEELKNIFDEFKPDIVHCFGTEYPHILAAARSIDDKNKLLIGIQGICFALAEEYMADLPVQVQKRFLFRDLLKWDNIQLQQQKFFKRGIHEKEALKLANHVTGRTEWDKKVIKSVNPQLHYHFMNETLRSNFYTGVWAYGKCQPYSIFLSQGDYPLKGLHYVLEAMPEILESYPEAHIFVAGPSVIAFKSLKEKLKISSYGKFLRDLIKINHLEDKITFLGKLNAEQMKNQYLRSHLFICPSTLENSPNSLGEAMILGVPCMASNVGGIPTIFSKEDGILFEAGNVKALAEGVKAMWGDQQKLQGYVKHARARAQCNHDPIVNYHTLVQIYQNIEGKYL